MDDFDNACRAFIASELPLEEFAAHLRVEPTQRANPYLALITAYENSDWEEAELRTRVAEVFTRAARQ